MSTHSRIPMFACSSQCVFHSAGAAVEPPPPPPPSPSSPAASAASAAAAAAAASSRSRVSCANAAPSRWMPARNSWHLTNGGGGHAHAHNRSQAKRSPVCSLLRQPHTTVCVLDGASLSACASNIDAHQALANEHAHTRTHARTHSVTHPPTLVDLPINLKLHQAFPLQPVHDG